MVTPKYIVTWRKEAPNQLDWDHHTCQTIAEVEQVVANIKKRGVHQYATYEIARKFLTLSSEY